MTSRKEKTPHERLREHLNDMPVGFPKTRSRAGIRLLKRLFTEDEALLSLHLDHVPRPADEIWERMKKSDKATNLPEKASFESTLYDIAKKGGIYTITRDGLRKFCLHPYVLGMFEIASARMMSGEGLPKEFVDDTSDFLNPWFGIEMLTIDKPGFRTIPVEESITPEHHVASYDDFRELVENSSGKFGVLDCVCKTMYKERDDPCKRTDRLETCMVLNDYAEEYIKLGYVREVSKEEFLEIARKNQEDGLVLQPENTKKPNFICACCDCCCGLLAVLKSMPRPADFATSNYHAVIDGDACTGCQVCVSRCTMDAIKIKDKKAKVKRARCIGCGNCIPTCKAGAIKLVKNKDKCEPLEDLEAYMDHLDKHRKSKLQKVGTLLKALLRIPQKKG